MDPLKDVLNRFHRIAEKAITFYPFLSNASLTLLNYSENATYLVKDKNGKQYILRVGRPGYHTRIEVESELEWLKSIHKVSNLQISLPLSGADGKDVQEVGFDGGFFYCTLFTLLEGSAPDENQESELIQQFEMLGSITAELHEHSFQNRKELLQLKRLTWDYETILGDHPKWGRWQDGLGIAEENEKILSEVSAKIKVRLEKFGKGPSRYGLIHSDLRLANLLVHKNQIKVIDFDDCGFGWFLYDLATSLSFIEHKPYVPSLIEAWTKGYRKIRPLSLEDEQEIPTFVLMRRLQLIAWIGSRDNETTRELGSQYTYDSIPLALKYLQNSKI